MTKSKLKISFVANTSWSIYNFRLEVAQHFKSLGHTIYVIAPRDKHSEKLIAEGFIFIESSVKPYSNNPLEELRYFYFLLKAYHQNKFDHIFHYTIKSNIYGSVAAKLLGLRSTAIVTGLGRLLNMNKGRRKSLIHGMYKVAVKTTSHLWFLNKEDQKYFFQNKISGSKTSKIIPSEGVNLNKYFKTKKKDFRSSSFLFAGRLLKEKGILLFIKAAEIVKNHYPHVRFDIVGFIDSKDNDSISQGELLDYQNREIVKYHGDTEDIRPYIAKTNCVVLSSTYGEGISRILLEAAAMETPIIASKNRGCEDVVIDGYNGFLCKKEDLFHLVDQMMAFISLDVEAKVVMGRNGRKLVKKEYDVAQVITVYEGHIGVNMLKKSKIKSLKP
tara:strand:- start:425 stop:1582 length:1158 start_codon:yes stop_codon:yes gene_type:complete